MPEWSSDDEALAVAVLDTLPEGVVVLDRGWTYRFVNEVAARFLHTRVEDLLGRGYYELYPEASGSPFERAYARVMAGGRGEVLDEYYAPWDQYFRNRVLPWGDGIIIFFSEVTEEHERAEADRRNRKLLQQVVDFAPVGITLVDRQGRYGLVNRFAAQGLGHPLQELLGRRPSEYLPPAIAERVAALEARVRHTGEPERAELRGSSARSDGGADGVRVYQAVVFPTFDETGAVSGTGAVYTDISAREEADRRLRQLAEELVEANGGLVRFQALVESSGDFIAIAGLDGQVLYLNPAGRAMVNMDPAVEVASTVIADYLTPEGLRASVEVEQPAVIAHGRWTGESTLRDLAGGPPIPVAIQSFLVRYPETGEPFALATVQRDIRERVAAENALVEADAQRRALLERLVVAQEQERAQIAADVHDDSVQALAAVDLRLGLLRRRIGAVAPQLVDQVEQLQQTVWGATERLRELLFDLEPPPGDLSLSGSVRDTAAHALEDGPTWELHDPDGADLAPSEKVKAVRIVKEALRNVRQHAHATRTVIRLRNRDRGVEVEIADDGVGIAGPEVSSPPGHRGLISMRDHAAIAGGWLTVEPGEGGGTRLRFWLPRAASGSDAGPGTPSG